MLWIIVFCFLSDVFFALQAFAFAVFSNQQSAIQALHALNVRILCVTSCGINAFMIKQLFRFLNMSGGVTISIAPTPLIKAFSCLITTSTPVITVDFFS